MEKEGNWLFSEVMIGISWFIFYFSNIILLLVVLMNFLIAIVSETYSEVTKESINNVYFFRSQLSEEYIEVWGKNVFKEKCNQLLIMTPEGRN